MKVLFIGTSLKVEGGMSKALARLVNVFCEDYGDDISIVLLGNRGHKEHTIPSNCSVFDLGIIKESKNIFEGILHNICINLKVYSVVEQEKPDVIFSFNPNIAVMCKIRFPNHVVVGTMRVNPNTYFTNNRRHRLFTRDLTWILNGFVFQTYGAALTYPALTRKKATVIPNGTIMPDAVVDINTLGNKTKIYASGRLSNGKRFVDIIRAFCMATVNHTEFNLVILGDGDERHYFEDYANKIGISERVIFRGYSKDPMKDMMDGYMYVFASDSEGYPNSLSEAIMIGLPCVATDCDFGPADIIKDGVSGLLVNVGDVVSMANAIRRLIENPELASCFSKNTAEYRELHGIQHIGKEYHDYIEKCFLRAK